MSLVVTVTVASDPNRTKIKEVDGFVATTVSPPPGKAVLLAVVVAVKLTVPVGRKGLIEPIGIWFDLHGDVKDTVGCSQPNFVSEIGPLEHHSD
jgi:hypothetical protein